MSEISIETFEPTAIRDNGLFMTNIDDLKRLIRFEVAVSQVVSIPPGEIGGNHKHPRQEAFICFDSEVEFHWVDKTGEHQVIALSTVDEPYRIVRVEPDVPHGVKNNSSHSITVIEFANAVQHDVESITVI